MFVLLAIIFVLTVMYWQCRRALPKAILEAVVEVMPHVTPKTPSLLQFTKNPIPIDWERLKANAIANRLAHRQLLERLIQEGCEKSKTELAQMLAEDEHDAAYKEGHIPQHITDYSKSVTHADCLVVLRKELGEKHWEAYERKNANAKIGAWIWLHTAIPYDNQDIRASYAICRVDTPERWERYTYFYRRSERIETSGEYCSVGYKDHDAAMATKPHIERKIFVSPSITAHEQGVLYRTKAVDEWYDFMRLHADATIGSLIQFYEGTLHNDAPIRVIYAIHRVDTPGRWEQHTYMFRLNERVSHF
jgi:hypothetical protein